MLVTDGDCVKRELFVGSEIPPKLLDCWLDTLLDLFKAFGESGGYDAPIIKMCNQNYSSEKIQDLCICTSVCIYLYIYLLPLGSDL